MTPYLIREGISVFSEELIEAAALIFLSAAGYLAHSFYQKELKSHQQKLEEAFNYIGAINVQIGQIKAVFDDVPKYPENKNDLKDILKGLIDKVLGIVNADWTLFRVIEISSGRTLTEYSRARGKAVLLKHEISNKDLLDDVSLDNCTVIKSRQKNLDIKVYCVIPVKSISKNQKILIKAIVNDLGMFYLIFSSVYYQKNHKKK